MKVLVLGASGMAGHVVATYLQERGGYKVNAPTHDELDVTDMTALKLYLDARFQVYDVVVNCIGILLGKAYQDVARTIYLNSYLPHYLEQRYAGTNTKVIHLSTDCVFSGEHGPYKENSPHDGQLLYDRSKSLGEMNNGKDLTFRMSIVGPELKENGEGLFSWFMRQTPGNTIYGFKNAIWNGITTVELAHAVDEAIDENLSGIYHLVPYDNVSKLDLLKLFNIHFRMGSPVLILPRVTIPSDKTLINTRQSEFGFVVQDYHHMMHDMNEWIERHAKFYPHYGVGTTP